MHFDREPGGADPVVSFIRWALMAAIAAALAWLALRPAPVAPDSKPAPPAPPTAPPAPSAVRILAPTPPNSPPALEPSAPGAAADTMRPPPLELSTGPLAWELQLADTTKGRDGAARARAIFQLLPTLPEQALATAAEQAVDKLPDRDYAAIATPVVTDPKTHAQALAALFADLMERPDTITLPALLSIARNPAHPYSEPALDNLRLLLRADHGRDWTAWEASIGAAVARQAK